MIAKHVPLVAALLLGLFGLCAQARESVAPKTNVPHDLTLVGAACPGLATGSLTYAKLSDLPAGVLLRTGELVIRQKELADQIAQAPQEKRAQLEKNAFFLLENLATRQFLVRLARAKTPEPNAAPASDDRELIRKYFQGLVAGVQVSEAEVAQFYEENKEACAGATLDQVKDTLRQLVLQQKQQDLVEEHIRTLGQRLPIEVSAAWTKEQFARAKDNPVDKARSSGRPSLVDFGSTGCQPCEMLAPILETLKAKYADKVNVLFIHVDQEQILAARYGVQSIPMQFFYDKDGREVFRHIGFWPQDQIEKKLAEMGVK